QQEVMDIGGQGGQHHLVKIATDQANTVIEPAEHIIRCILEAGVECQHLQSGGPAFGDVLDLLQGLAAQVEVGGAGEVGLDFGAGESQFIGFQLQYLAAVAQRRQRQAGGAAGGDAQTQGIRRMIQQVLQLGQDLRVVQCLDVIQQQENRSLQLGQLVEQVGGGGLQLGAGVAHQYVLQRSAPFVVQRLEGSHQAEHELSQRVVVGAQRQPANGCLLAEQLVVPLLHQGGLAETCRRAEQGYPKPGQGSQPVGQAWPYQSGPETSCRTQTGL